MEETQEIIEQRKEQIVNKIKNKFKNKYDLLALIVIVLSAIFRYYWLFKTKHQALWFDEGTYFVQARHWALGTAEYFEPARDWFVSLIWAGFIKVGLNEFAIRFITVSVGIFSLYLFYILVAYFFGKKIGLISMILAAVFYEPIFWSLRLDIGTYSIFFMIASLVFFTKGLKQKKLTPFLVASAFAAFSLMAHAPGIFIILFYIVFVPIYSKFKFYKSKKFWLCVLFFFLILTPFFIKNIVTSQQIYPRYQTGWIDRGGEGKPLMESLVYATSLPRIIGKLVFFLFLIGLIISLDWTLIIDKFFKKDLTKRNWGKIFFLIFGAISLFLRVQSLLFDKGGAYFEPRYVIPFYFGCFVFAGIGINFIAQKIKKYSKFLSIIFIFAILVFVSHSQLNRASDLIEIKSQSYQGIKQAGEWLNINSNQEDKIISFETPQIIYYSGRQGFGIPRSNEDVKQMILDKKAKYLVVWAGLGQERITQLLNFIENEENIIPKGFFPTNSQQPTTGVYEIQDLFFT